MSLHGFKHILFEGAGIRGLSYCGVVEELEKTGMLENLESHGGVSSGSIYALMLNLGFTSLEITDFLCNELDMSKVLPKTCLVTMIYNLITTFGIYSNKNVRKGLETILERKGLSSDITLYELYKKTGKLLLIVTSSLTQSETLYLSYLTTPNAKVIDCVLASIAYPLGFKLTKFNLRGKQEYCIDGGILNNFPLYVFNDVTKLTNPLILKSLPISPYTLGVKCLDSQIAPSYTPKSIFSYIKQLLALIILNLENQTMYYEYTKQIIYIDTETVELSALSFDLSETDKDVLVYLGKKSVENFIRLKE